MNEENFRAWLNEMWTTDKPQATGNLCALTNEGADYALGYCCLGLGSMLVPNIVTHNFVDEESGSIEKVAFGDEGCDELAPAEFIEWLGFTHGSAHQYDLRVDWDESLRVPNGGFYEDSSDLTSAASLNDSGFNFKQIADIFNHFGVRNVIED